jgi:hypothetical protein
MLSPLDLGVVHIEDIWFIFDFFERRQRHGLWKLRTTTLSIVRH